MLHRMSATRSSHPASLIPQAGFDDLDLDDAAGEQEWERRVMELAASRIAAARERFERLGIIDADGELVSTALPPDMLPDSDTSLETG